MTENERLTHSRASGIKTGYWSPSTKAELVERLAAYEDTGLEPQEVQALADDSRRSDEAAAGWISVEDKLPEPFEDVLVCYTCGKVTCGFKSFSGGWSLESSYGPATHWMPLPPPPKEVTP